MDPTSALQRRQLGQLGRPLHQLLSLPPELQERISTAEGHVKVSAIAQLATTCSGDEAIEVYDKIAGFKQSIQEEILKRTERRCFSHRMAMCEWDETLQPHRSTLVAPHREGNLCCEGPFSEISR